MSFASTPKDSSGIPISCVYVPGVGFVALQGSTNTNTDASNNQSTPANFNLTQINGVAPQFANADGIAVGNIQAEGLYIFNGSTLDRWRAINGLGDGAASGMGGAGEFLFNGTSWDRQRGNLDNISLINASAVSATQTSADQTNFNGRGIKVYLNVTTIGTGSLVVTIQGKDPVSGQYYTILAGVAVTTNSFKVYTVYPGLTAAANAVANDVLPRTWNVTVTGANGSTFTVSASVLL